MNTFLNIKSIFDKKNTKIILVILGILLCIFGLMDKIFENTIYNLMKGITLPYIQKSYEESKKLFMTLSLLKGVLDVIEGSTLNVSMVLGINIEVGDIVQPLYDIINSLWKISLASVVILKLETIYYEIFRVKLGGILIFFSLLAYFPSLFFDDKIKKISKKLTKYIFGIFTFIYLLLPTSLIITSKISEYFEKEYKNVAVNELDVSFKRLEKVKNELFTLEQSKSIFNIPGQIEGVKAKIDNFGREIDNISKDLINNIPIIIGITLLSNIVFPILILFLLYNLIKMNLTKK